MRFVIGRYRPSSSSKKTITRMDIIMPNQTAKQVALRVADIHGYKLSSYRVKTMTEEQYRKRYINK